MKRWPLLLTILILSSSTAHALQINPTNFSKNWNKETLTTENMSVAGNTCGTNGNATLFGTCSLDLKTNSNEGHIVLNNSKVTSNHDLKPDNGKNSS